MKEPAPDLLVRFGYEPIRIELFTTVAALDFSECWSKRCTIETDGIQVDFIDRDSLVLSKIAAGRPQDLADLEQLRRTMRP
jgi:predicted nucleotidyltransferase